MTAIPVSYIARNLMARKLTTILTAGGMALVSRRRSWPRGSRITWS